MTIQYSETIIKNESHIIQELHLKFLVSFIWFWKEINMIFPESRLGTCCD